MIKGGEFCQISGEWRAGIKMWGALKKKGCSAQTYVV